MPLAPGALVGPYRLDRFLGQGGVAPVYTASHTVLGGVFAVKIYPTGGMPELADRTRFQREIATITRLRHPNLLAVVDYGHDADGTYLVGDWMDGGSLAARIGAAMSVADVVRILGPIAAALDYAHAEGVLHRDVKATNVLFTLDGRPMLADFALTSLVAASQATTLPTGGLQAMAGMPPEQALGEAVVPQTDQYALAILAYQLLAGGIPFRPAAPLAVPPPRQANPSLSAELEQALLKGLARRPDDRYASAGDLIAAIERASGVGSGAADAVAAPAPGSPAPAATEEAAKATTLFAPEPPSPPAAETPAESTQQVVLPPATTPEATAPRESPTVMIQAPVVPGSPADAGPAPAQEAQRTQPVELPHPRPLSTAVERGEGVRQPEPAEPPTVMQPLPSLEGRPGAPEAASRDVPPTVVESPAQPPVVPEASAPDAAREQPAATVLMRLPATPAAETAPTVFEPAPAPPAPPPPPPPPVSAPTVAVPFDASPSPPAVAAAPTVYEAPSAVPPREGGPAGPRPPVFPWAAAGAVAVAALAVVLVLAWLLHGRGSGGLAAAGTAAAPTPTTVAATEAPVAATAASTATVAPAATATAVPSPQPTATAATAAPSTAVPTPRASAAPAFMPARLVAAMGSGQSFCGAVADDDGGQVFVSDSDRGQLVAFDPATRQQTRAYDVKEWLCGLALDQQRGAVWAPVYHRQASGGFDTSRLASVDLASGAIRYFAGSHFPLAPFLDQRTGTLYAGNSADPSLLVVNVRTDQDTDAVPVSAQVNRLASSPVNGYLYMAAVETNMFLVFDPGARKVATELRVGQQPWGVAAEPSSGMILVSSEGAGQASLVDPRTNKVVRTYKTGSHPHDVACGGPDRHCFVLNSADRTITTVDTASDRTVTSAMLPGEDPLTAMAVAPKTGRVFVVSKRQVFVLDEET